MVTFPRFPVPPFPGSGRVVEQTNHTEPTSCIRSNARCRKISPGKTMRTRARSRETSSPRKLQVASCKLLSLFKELCEACPAGGKWCLPPERFTPSTRTSGFHTNVSVLMWLMFSDIIWPPSFFFNHSLSSCHKVNVLRHILGASPTFYTFPTFHSYACLDMVDVFRHNFTSSLLFFIIIYPIITRSMFSDTFDPSSSFLIFMSRLQN